LWIERSAWAVETGKAPVGGLERFVVSADPLIGHVRPERFIVGCSDSHDLPCSATGFEFGQRFQSTSP
jgi:hypothetical protein